eukprot:15131186-Alexandrium_andersonii.AAC.1
MAGAPFPARRRPPATVEAATGPRRPRPALPWWIMPLLVFFAAIPCDEALQLPAPRPCAVTTSQGGAVAWARHQAA